MDELKNIIHHALEKNALGFEKSFDAIMNDKIDGVLNSALDNHFSAPESDIDIVSEETDTISEEIESDTIPETNSELESISEEIINEAQETDE